MNRDQLLKRLDREWQGFVQACQGLPQDALLEPGVVGEWSVKDLMGHIATWEEESMAVLGLIMQGKRTPRYAQYGGIDAFNARQWQRHRAEPLEEARRRRQDAHARLVAALTQVPEHHYATETRLRRRLRLDTYGHYREHYRQVLAWRQARGL